MNDTAERDRYQRGLATMGAIGAASPDGGNPLLNALGDIAPDLARDVVAYGFGDVYSRPGLEPRQRQLVTLGMLTALGDCAPELELHINVALDVGLSGVEIVEALTQSAVYCGFPRALNAISVAKRVLAERGLLPVPPAERR